MVYGTVAVRIIPKLPKHTLISKQWITTSEILKMYSASNVTNNSGKVRVVDLRSDTLTKPTELMKIAMFEAELGDDVYGEDPTVNALEEKSAKLLGKEAGLFVPSGTMGNLIATMVHCDRRGCEMIVGASTHMFTYEQGGAAQIAGVQLCTLPNKSDGTFDLDDMESHVHSDDDHEAITALVCVENTHNMCGGKVIPLEWLDELAQRTQKLGIPLHMDGARLFNAALYLKVPASRIVQNFATVTFCLSKGLGAPAGSVLVGNKQFIRKARRMRKALGGGMRQVGVLAAAGIVGLDNRERMLDDHARAATIARAIVDSRSKYFKVDLENLHTNILIINLDPSRVTAQAFCKRLSTVTEGENNRFGDDVTIVKIAPINNSCARLVTHEGISDADVKSTINKLKFILEEYECA